MISVTIQCDICKTETATFNVRNPNDVFTGLKRNGFRFITHDDKPQKLVGPECHETYKAKLVEAEAAKEKILTDWYSAQKGTP